MTSARSTSISTPCPKCKATMVHVAVTAHPLMPEMQRNTFVCYSCNQTRTYMLPVQHRSEDGPHPTERALSAR
ncbi:MAG TPA: hypothetical protein VFB45_14645 [Pseudolabrys sp.]|nr:hypothetical protein [Pseudolabrys sp.]